MEPSQNQTPHRGGLILALGIVSLVACQFLGIAPWLMGKADLQEMEAGRMDSSGRGLTDAGRILGIVSLAMCVLGIVLGVVWLVFVIGVTAVSNA